MEAEFQIPFDMKFFLGSFKIPSIGKFIHQVIGNVKEKYSYLDFALIGFKDELLRNNIQMNQDNLKPFNTLKSLFSIVNNSISETENQHLLEIKNHVSSILNSIDEIIQIASDRLEYQNFKRDIH